MLSLDDVQAWWLGGGGGGLNNAYFATLLPTGYVYFVMVFLTSEQ